MALLTPAEVEVAERIRMNIIGLQLELSMFRFELALRANFNPSQPRVPAGNSDGGRWTRVGGPLGSGPSRTSRPTEPVAGREGEATAGAGSGTVGRASPEASAGWTVISRRSDVSSSEETVVNNDGTAIRSEVSKAPLTSGWTERHTVIGRDGSVRTFQNLGFRQQVFDSSVRIIAEGTWMGRGAVPEAAAEPAFAGPVLLEKTVELGLALYTWLSTRNSRDEKAIVAFSAREYAAGEAPELGLDYVGTLPRDRVEKTCPRLGEVQWRTDEAVDTVRRRGAIDLSPTQFGTAVHVSLKTQISDLDDPDFRAEVSVLKTLYEAYGTKDSVRIDVFENVRNGTVCVYDIKTGRSGLTAGRAREIAQKVFDSYGGARQIIVIETRPTR